MVLDKKNFNSDIFGLKMYIIKLENLMVTLKIITAKQNKTKRENMTKTMALTIFFAYNDSSGWDITLKLSG